MQMGNCPFCGEELREGSRQCAACRRECTPEELAAGSRLKECYGSFPASKVECYLCADEQKCSRISLVNTQTQILGWMQAIDSTNRLLFSINDRIDEVLPTIEAMNASLQVIHEVLQKQNRS